MACIITFARSWQALIAARALGNLGIKVITADTDGFATAFFSRYSKNHFLYPDPYTDEKKFIKKLIEKANHYKKLYKEDVMILPIQKETLVISKYKTEISKHAKLCIENYSKITNLHNKSRIPLILKNHRIPSPKTYIIKDIVELYKLTPNMRFPVFLKFQESCGAIGLEKISTRDDLIYKFRKFIKRYNLKPENYPIIQEYAAGKDYCVTAILNKGKLKAMMIYQNIKTYPHKSGTGVYRKTVKIPQIERVAKRFLKAIKWHGVIEIDFRMSRDKKPYLIEVNPRFWGGLNQAIASNVNYPLLAYNIAMKGDCQTVTKVTSSIRTENLLTALLGLIDEISSSKSRQEELKLLQSYWRKAFKSKAQFQKNINLFFKSLNAMNKKKLKAIQSFIERKKIIKYDILDREDPFVLMGIFYPIGLFLKHRKLSQSILVGEPELGKRK